MKGKKGVAQSGFNVKPFDWQAWMNEQKRKRREYLERERLRTQLCLPLKVPSKAICPDCGCRRGVSCRTCNSTGFIDRPVTEEAPAPERELEECRRCWGVGQVANKDYLSRICPNCHGEGKVEAQGD